MNKENAIFFSDTRIDESQIRMVKKIKEFCNMHNFKLLKIIYRYGDDTCYHHFDELIKLIKINMNELMMDMRYLHCEPITIFVQEDLAEDKNHILAWSIIASLKNLNLIKIYFLKKNLQERLVGIDEYDKIVTNPIRLAVKSMIKLKNIRG